MERGIQGAKNELQLIMSHQMVILRDILSTLRQEQTALIREDHKTLSSIVEDRFVLVRTFNEWNTQFSPVLKCLAQGVKGTPHFPQQEETFPDSLKGLADYLNEEDFELLLLREQLLEVVKEIHEQTSAMLYYLENKPIGDEHQNLAVYSSTNFLRFTVQQLRHKKAIVGLLDAESKDQGST
jgi:hypothetical protein